MWWVLECPQGSFLSPILFACFINLYTDDLQLYTVDLGRGVDTLVGLLNEDLKRIHRWSVDISLALNVSKPRR
jgi:hypothetical protein